MGYQVKLDAFEGPLDLLLHLIEKQELDIHDIPIAVITEQYLDYLKAMDELDLGVASEFLVIGATLLSIKAKMLLPKPPIQEEEPDSTMDPREELVIRLLEYKKYKDVVDALQIKEAQHMDLYTHPFDLSHFISGLVPPNPLQHVSPWDLLAVYKEALEEAIASGLIRQINQAEVTVGKQMEYILETLSTHREGLGFRDILPVKPSPAVIVVSFLALLELLRLKQVKIYQRETFGHILILPFQKALIDGGKENVVC